MISVSALVTVYLAFAVKQLVADYFLQTAWMVHGKGAERDWVIPLAAHAGIHAAGTLLIVLAVRPSFWWLAAVDFVLHFAIDRGKALAVRRLGYSVMDSGFWWAIGSDQALHQVTHFAFLLLILTA